MKYCGRWRPCSDTSTQSKAKTARSRWSERPELGEIWKKQFENKIENNMGSTSTGTFDKHEGIDEGESDAAKWAVNTINLETACLT